jgi:hypothetical protein
MASIPLNDAGVRDVKRALVARFPKHKSAHLSEALAAALGFRTSVSLQTALREVDHSDPTYALLDEGACLARLAAVSGRKMGINDRSLLFDNIRYAEGHSVVKTRSIGYRRVKYAKSTRLRAWRNMLIAGINAALDRRLFTIRPGDNRWPGREGDKFGRHEAYVFDFELEGIPALCSVHDAGYDELAIHVALWPTPDGSRWVGAAMAGFLAGDAYASGWLERREGAWLQVSTQRLGDQFSCRRDRLKQVASIEIAPTGYGDRGSFQL